MQEYELEILAPAWADIEEIADYHLVVVGPISARNITDQILASLERLKTYPLSGVAVLDDELNALGYRFVTSWKYVCIYRAIGDTIFVYHIVHGSRDFPRLFKE
ncbi:MAG TPA: type II toxin-antitoxin system RelE/ParE family toxin [Clostridia bacterium]